MSMAEVGPPRYSVRIRALPSGKSCKSCASQSSALAIVGASSAPTLNETMVEQLPSTASRISRLELRNKLMRERELKAEFAALGKNRRDDRRVRLGRVCR